MQYEAGTVRTVGAIGITAGAGLTRITVDHGSVIRVVRMALRLVDFDAIACPSESTKDTDAVWYRWLGVNIFVRWLVSRCRLHVHNGWRWCYRNDRSRSRHGASILLDIPMRGLPRACIPVHDPTPINPDGCCGLCWIARRGRIRNRTEGCGRGQKGKKKSRDERVYTHGIVQDGKADFEARIT
jgi:hypothetical protein